jgi:serine/threonine protein kinase
METITDNATTMIGRFELIRSLGSGSQGSVYLARDSRLDRFVAIKVLTGSDTELTNETEDGTPLEARIASGLKHPNIVPIYDVGECAAGPYLVFEYVEGRTLRQALSDHGALPLTDAVPIFASILKALAAAHATGIVHLDLSPRNILLDESNVARVMDFGLSQFVQAAALRSEVTTGTLRYMAPEHFKGEPLGTWTDVFALGSTFFELLTSLPAMRGATLPQIRQNIEDVKVDFDPVTRLRNGEQMARFLSGALVASQAGRYSDCGVMSEAFELFLAESGLAGNADSAATQHSTVEFLLRRMQRKQDFPTISSTLADINRLTGSQSEASADKLANVILRDLALTSKLLKLVNSAFYGSRTAEITNISQAVVLLGLEQVRMTANSLTLFGHLKGDSAILKDSMTKSFLAGLIARHLAQRAALPQAEEAFICGLCQNLGENLVIYYFPDEYEEVCGLRSNEQLDKNAASRGVLGVSYATLGAAVAKNWNLPGSIVMSIKGMPPGPIRARDEDADRLRDFAVFANALCELFVVHETEEITETLDDLLKQFNETVSLDLEYALKLVNAAFEKLKQYSQVFEINVDQSGYCQSVKEWIDRELERLSADDELERV